MKKSKLKLIFLVSIVILSLLVFSVLLAGQLKNNNNSKGNKNPEKNTVKETKEQATMDGFLESDAIKVDLLPINKFSRPGTKVDTIKSIVVHYVGNPGTTAAQNRSYFNNLATLGTTYASSHYVIGLQGEIIQCVPLDEIAYASNDRNHDTISIECCHQDAEGKFNPDTYDSLVNLTAALCRTYGLEPETGIIRHYDVTGKLCPIYYAKNEDEWVAFKLAVKNAMR